jgi:hypothetical protein
MDTGGATYEDDSRRLRLLPDLAQTWPRLTVDLIFRQPQSGYSCAVWAYPCFVRSTARRRERAARRIG